MAQLITYEDAVQQTYNFLEVANGDIFIYNNEYRVKMNNNNPNYVVIDSGAIGKMEDTDQVIWPDNVLLKVE